MLKLCLGEGRVDELFEGEDVVDGDVFVDLVHGVGDGGGEGCGERRWCGRRARDGSDIQGPSMGADDLGREASRGWRCRRSCRGRLCLTSPTIPTI